MMRIRYIDPEPFHKIHFFNAGSRGMGTYLMPLPFFRGTTKNLPKDVEALVIASDLQGRERDPDGHPQRLLGEALCDELQVLSDLEELPPLDRCGVILAGDLYASPMADKRGATGDVREVWTALAKRCRWVVGVAGNHDLFGPPEDMRQFLRTPKVHLLDVPESWYAVRTMRPSVEKDGLHIAGLGGIMGNPKKPNRRPHETFSRHVENLISTNPDILVLHEGPEGDGDLRGNAILNPILENRPTLVVFGHCHWAVPMIERGSTQLLNVDGRVLVLR